MSGLTENTLSRIDKWLSQGMAIESMFPRLEQRYRMQICSEFYKRWVQNTDRSLFCCLPVRISHSAEPRNIALWRGLSSV